MTVRATGRGAGNVLGFEVSGDVTEADDDLLTLPVAAAVEQHGTVRSSSISRASTGRGLAAGGMVLRS